MNLSTILRKPGFVGFQLVKRQLNVNYCMLSGQRRLSSANAPSANLRARRDLAACFRILSRMGLNEGVCNHLSLRAPSEKGDKEVYLMVPYGIHWSLVKASDLVGIDKEGRVVEGEAVVELSARKLHASVQSCRDNIHCAIHTHMPYTTALACLKNRVFPMIHQNCPRFVNNMAYDDGYCGLIEDEEEGQRLASLLGRDKEVLMMKNHGVLCVGPSIAETFDTIYYLERTAMLICHTLWTGKELKKMSDEAIRNTAESCVKTKEEYSKAFFEAEYAYQKSLTPDFEH